MDQSYRHLGLKRWPFAVVPQREHCTFIAARAQVRQDVDSLIDNLSRRDTSSIHLFWSWYGADKTHTLYYIGHRAALKSQVPFARRLCTIYSEFPRSARSFLDLYRAYIVGLDLDTLTDAYLEISTCRDGDRLEREMFLASPDLGNALRVLATGRPADHSVAVQWLRADSLPVSEFRRVGIKQRIRSSDEAIRILATLINLLDHSEKCQNRHGCRILWMLDEFQRIESAGRTGLQEINTGLHSLFNACPTCFSLFLSFSGRPESDRLPPLFSNELRDRIGLTKVIVLPPLQIEQGTTFVEEILANCRDSAHKPRTPFFPFNKDSCRAILHEIQKSSELKPRTIMQAFNAVLQEADPRIEAGQFTSIPAEFATDVLSQYITLHQHDDERE